MSLTYADRVREHNRRDLATVLVAATDVVLREALNDLVLEVLDQHPVLLMQRRTRDEFIEDVVRECAADEDEEDPELAHDVARVLWEVRQMRKCRDRHRKRHMSQKSCV